MSNISLVVLHSIIKKYYNKMKLHLGCGARKLDGWVNIDLDSTADIVHDIRKLEFISDTSVDEIYISHCLEHISRKEIFDVLCEYNRVLKYHGVLRIAVPDYDSITSIYEQDKKINTIVSLLYGGQKDEYDYHKICFNLEIMTELLSNCGFSDVQRYDAWEFLGTRDDFSKACIPHMDRSGKLMSLNITCKKVSNVYHMSQCIEVFTGLKKFYPT